MAFDMKWCIKHPADCARAGYSRVTGGQGGAGAQIRQAYANHIKPVINSRASYMTMNSRIIQPFADTVIVPSGGLFSADPFATSVPYTDNRGYMQPTWPPMYLEAPPARQRKNPPGWGEGDNNNYRSGYRPRYYNRRRR